MIGIGKGNSSAFQRQKGFGIEDDFVLVLVITAYRDGDDVGLRGCKNHVGGSVAQQGIKLQPSQIALSKLQLSTCELLKFSIRQALPSGGPIKIENVSITRPSLVNAQITAPDKADPLPDDSPNCPINIPGLSALVLFKVADRRDPGSPAIGIPHFMEKLQPVIGRLRV